MQFTIIIGGFAIIALKLPAIALVVMVFLKMIMDLQAHSVEELQQQQAAGMKNLNFPKLGST